MTRRHDAPLTIDDLWIRASSHTPFFGVYLAAHAIPDALCMCHASVGCKVKTQQHLVDHDGVADAHNRMRYSQFIDEDLIAGSTAQLEDEIRVFQRRRQSQVVLIDSSTPISLQAQRLGPVCTRLEAALGVDVVAVDARNYDADLWQGYDAAMAALLQRQTWPPLEATAGDEVAIVGYPFDRYEPDHIATVAELRGLVRALSLQAKAVWLAGEPYATLQQLTTARHVVLLPWAGAATERALQQVGRQPLRLGLPMGLDATARWLHGLAAAAGVAAPRAQRVIDHERARVEPLLALAHRRLAGRGVWVGAEAPRAAGLLALLREVGARVPMVSVAHFSLGDAGAVRAMVEAWTGLPWADDTAWIDDPEPTLLGRIAALSGRWRADRQRSAASPAALAPPPPDLPEAERALARALTRCDVAIGSTIDRDGLDAAGLPFVELGYPSERRHFLFPAPWLGYHGALRVVEQVLHALERDDRRRDGGA